MRALITGVGGFCGAHLTARLRREDVEVAGVDLTPLAPAHLGSAPYFRGTAEAVATFRPDWLFHLAAVSGASAGPGSIYETNVGGTVQLLDAVRKCVPACRVLLVGSFAEYGPVPSSSLPVTEDTPCEPVGPYGIGKLAATLIGLEHARRFGSNVVIMRPSNIIGAGTPKSLVVGALLARAREALATGQTVVRLGDGESERDFIAVTDVVDAYVRALRAGLRGEVFNLCAGTATSIWNVAEKLLASSPRPLRLEVDGSLAPSPIRSLYGSYEKARRAFGFCPSTSLEDALASAWHAEMDTTPCG